MELYPIDIAIHLVNIGILYLLLRLLVWKPVRSFMAAREARVAGEIHQAEELKAQALELKSQYDAQLADARNTCDQLLADGRREAQSAGAQYLAQAKEQAAAIVTQAKTDAQDEKLRALEEAKGDLADLAVDMAGRILRFDADIRRNLVSDTEKTGTRTGVLKVAQPSDQKTLDQITARLENLLACHLELTVEVDPAIVGGFSALVDGKVYDFSYRAQLSEMQHRLA